MDMNKVYLIGRLTRDPKILNTKTETEIVTFSIAVNRKWKDKNGEQQEKVNFIDCKAFNKTAISINNYFCKGRPICIEGRLELEKWISSTDGTPQNKLKVIVDEFHFVDSPDKWNKKSLVGSSSEIEDSINYDSVDNL